MAMVEKYDLDMIMELMGEYCYHVQQFMRDRIVFALVSGYESPFTSKGYSLE